MANPPGARPLDESRYLPLAIRAYTERIEPQEDDESKRRGDRPSPGWKLPSGILIFDTETTTDPGQTLTFGSAGYYKPNPDGTLRLIERVLFHADDLEDRDPKGYACLQAEGARLGIDLFSRREFCDHVLWPLAGQARAWVVGFNLPFDLARLAVAHGDSRIPDYYGGFSLQLWAYRKPDGTVVENRYRPRIEVKALDSKRAFIGFSRAFDPDPDDQIPEGSRTGQRDKKWTFHGYFLDLRTLCFALTNKAPNLQGACKLFGVEGKKDEGKVEHGKITPRYIAYNLQDVEASARLCERMLNEYRSHPLELSPTKVYSPASIGKAYLDALGLRGLHTREAEFPREKLGQAMSAYYGGRAECRIRAVPLPVVTVDFLSMYPTVNALMGVWPLISAKRITAVDATADAQAFLDQLTADACFAPETWKQMTVICQVAPDGDVLPARCSYGKKKGWQIGCNPLTSSTPLWYALPDLCAAKILGGKTPKILSAYRLVPQGRQAGLRRVMLRGEVEIDPVAGDPFRTLIEQRKLLDHRTDIGKVERERLGRALKVVANSAGYGIFAEVNQTSLGTRTEPIRIYGLGAPSERKLNRLEHPGRFSLPPIAACITAAARLMLALLERLVTDAGGSYVYCDTDAMAIVSTETSQDITCPGGPHTDRNGNPAVRALSWNHVDEIRERFTSLNPYDRAAVPDSILQVEKVNYHEDRRRQMHAYSLSAKRYCLFSIADGVPVVHPKRRSEHGLGHLRNPLDPEDEDRSWITESWQVILNDAHKLPGRKPRWVSRPAVSQLAASSPPVLQLFTDYNNDLTYDDAITPFNFLLACYVTRGGHPIGYPADRFQLIAPYTKDARQWVRMRWTDRYSSATFPISTSGNLSNPDVVRVDTYRTVLDTYITRPEPKSLDSTGQVCDGQSIGVLQRRPVRAAIPTYIGKESNLLEDRTAGRVTDINDAVQHYSDPDGTVWTTVVRPTLNDMRTTDIAKRSGLVDRQIQRLIRGDSNPRPDHRDVLTAIAADHASGTLQRWGIAPPNAPIACLTHYADERRNREDVRACPVCGKPPRSKRAIYCSETCKAKARVS